MKKIVALSLAILMLLSLSACGKTWQEYYDLGMTKYTEGSYNDAIKAFGSAIKLEPDTASAYVARGDSYLATGEAGYESAMADYTAALEKDPAAGGAYVGLGKVYIAQGLLDQAGEALSKGVEQLGDDQAFREALTAIYSVDSLPGITWEVAGLTLHVSTIADAAAVFGSQPGYSRSVMNYGQPTEGETIYNMPYFNDDDPDNDMAFGFIASQFTSSTTLDDVGVHEPSWLCFGKYHCGEAAAALLQEWCGLDSLSFLPAGNYMFYNDGTNSLSVAVQAEPSLIFVFCNIDGNRATAIVKDDVLYSLSVQSIVE